MDKIPPMNRNEEHLTRQIINDAYRRLSDGRADPSDKIIIVLERNHDATLSLAERVNHLICKISASNGKPITLRDKLQIYTPPAVGGSGVLFAVGWLVKYLIGS